ncbi:MAG: hypothetical protein RDU89_04565 [bacterium]|nr:hypothetical protein [bacterium]
MRSTLKIILGVCMIGIGVCGIGLAVAAQAGEPWLYVLGLGLICWGAWDIYKQVRDRGVTG